MQETVGRACDPGEVALTFMKGDGKRVASLRQRAAKQLAITIAAVAIMIFMGAGSLSFRFWQAWLFLGLMAGFWIFFSQDFLKNDPALMERRLKNDEVEPHQRLFQKLFFLILVTGFTVTGLDFRFGWSRNVAFPVVLILAGQFLAVSGYLFVYWVMKTNSFAGSTIEVEAGQNVIHSGPYAIVRHPMYTGMSMTALGIPLALASYMAMPIFALTIPLLMFRVIHEERTLQRDLPGYPEYCEQTRFRLVPWIW